MNTGLLENDAIMPMANTINIAQIMYFFLLLFLLCSGIFDTPLYYIVSKLVMNVQAAVIIIIWGATIAIIGGRVPVLPSALNTFTMK